LIANLCRISDKKGGWKALDTAALRDILHAATAFGRVASAATAIELGYAIEPDDGPSGRLGHWQITGVPEGACQLFSKRSAEVTAAVESRGYQTYQARQVAARDTRKAKRHTPPEDLMAGWHCELWAAGYSAHGLIDGVEKAAAGRGRDMPAVLNEPQLAVLANHLLGPSGRLAHQKVFTRADVAVAAGPVLFGFGPRELLRVMERVCAHPDAVPLVGVKAAREPAYAPACAIANEAAIAFKAAIQAERRDAPAVGPGAVNTAIAAKERELGGRPLTSGQKEMVAAVVTSGRGVELVVGVAGAGKSTALDAARRAFEDAGFKVLGTAVSGQAARTLRTDAGIDEARTIASLLWRLDHGQFNLDRQTVIVCDEAGMADDPAMLRLLAATEAAGSKLVIVGDHHQIGAVGPGGSLEALVSRHAGGVHVLKENVRQADPEERAVLAQLREGDVDQAVRWYAGHERVEVAPGREEALDRMAAAWAEDVAEGKETAMLAWRRANVTALNSRARAAMAKAGRLSGPELSVGGNVYQAGDRVVTLAPTAHGRLVTSQRGKVVAVDPETERLTLSMDDGSIHTLGREEAGADRLAHGYATTVHRSQGATFDTAHLFADGGGRELGYVGMSRAKASSRVYVVADNVGQAVEDLSWDWGRERRQLWAIDSGTPEAATGRHPLEVEADNQVPAVLRAVLGRARLKAERAAVASLASNGLDAGHRRRVDRLDSYIRVLERRFGPRYGQPTPGPTRADVSTPDRGYGPEL
jgi:hypothetical protein